MNVSNGIELYNSTYPTSRDNRKNIIDEVIDKIKADNILLFISDEELYLVIDEALTNAMEHGNRWDAGKRVKVKVTKYPDLLHVYIADEGEGFDIRNTLLDNSSVKSLKPRGRGLYIVRQFCKPGWNEKGNEIDLEFKTK
jgi:two-component sensor histidine kinase